MTKIDVGCAECGIGGGHALYCVACAEKFVGGYKDSGVPAVQTGLEQVSPDTPKDKALKMALEALENGDVPTPENAGKNLDAITAIKEALTQRTEQNFCSRCGKRVGGIDSIHTCTPPMEKNT